VAVLNRSEGVIGE